MTINDLLKNNQAIYSIPDDRFYCVDDLLHNLNKFLLLYLKSIDQDNRRCQIFNLNIAFAWYLALTNRFHLDIENLIWRRYSYKCPFCLDIPCGCKNNQINKGKKTGRPSSRKPIMLAEWQNLVKKIYPNQNIAQTISLLISNYQKMSDTFRIFMREKRKSQFREIETCMSDYFVLFMRVYNHYNDDIASSYKMMFKDGCYVCHQVPCECNYFE